MPFIWICAVSAEAQVANEATVQHYWDNHLRRWHRSPSACVTDKADLHTPNIQQFQMRILEGPCWQDRRPSPILQQIRDLRTGPSPNP